VRADCKLCSVPNNQEKDVHAELEGTSHLSAPSTKSLTIKTIPKYLVSCLASITHVTFFYVFRFTHPPPLHFLLRRYPSNVMSTLHFHITTRTILSSSPSRERKRVHAQLPLLARARLRLCAFRSSRPPSGQFSPCSVFILPTSLPLSIVQSGPRCALSGTTKLSLLSLSFSSADTKTRSKIG
jgi:hypothetical protein